MSVTGGAAPPLPDAAVDAAFMGEALALARRGEYSTSPNPRVGCVLVRDGVVIGRGFHRRAGGPHAEVEALADAGAARGATAYVTLEPCNHHGRTPPCSAALVAAGVARVVYAIEDPNPRVAGSGAATLRAAGIAVSHGTCAAEAAALNRGFLTRMGRGRPWVTVKLAMSLDARAALADGQSQWITGPAARADVQRLRARACAIVTGSGTVLADDPSLTVRDPDLDTGGRQPRRVVLDRRLRTPATARMLGLPGETRVICAPAALVRAAALRAAGAVVEALPEDANGLAGLLAHLARLECNEVLVEAGPTLAGAFLGGGHFDELIVYSAPRLLGVGARPAFAVPSPALLADSLALTLQDSTLIGPDLRVVLAPAIAHD